MKYKLIIDKESEEEIIAIVKEPSALTEEIENLVLSYTGKCSGRAKNATLRPEKNDQFGQREIANAHGRQISKAQHPLWDSYQIKCARS